MCISFGRHCGIAPDGTRVLPNDEGGSAASDEAKPDAPAEDEAMPNASNGSAYVYHSHSYLFYFNYRSSA